MDVLRKLDHVTFAAAVFQPVGLFLSASGLTVMPVGDNMYEVPNDRLQLPWFICLWSFVSSLTALLGYITHNTSVLLLSLVLMAISSTIYIVTANFVNGFTRWCHTCAGEALGQPCPSYISNCELGKSLFIAGAVFQIGSLYGLMFASSRQRQTVLQGEGEGETEQPLVEETPVDTTSAAAPSSNVYGGGSRVHPEVTTTTPYPATTTTTSTSAEYDAPPPAHQYSREIALQEIHPEPAARVTPSFVHVQHSRGPSDDDDDELGKVKPGEDDD